MSGAPIKLSYNFANNLTIQTKQRFTGETANMIARARAGAFGSVFNPGRTKSIARGMEHQGDRYRAHIRSLTDRKSDFWTEIPPEFANKREDFKDKRILKKINKLLKANNTYQTPKK